MIKLEQAFDTIRYVRQQTDEVILFNSFGKDSLVVLDLIAPYFKRVVCVFMYFVPNLDHINRFINQVVCRYNNVEVVQIPHWNLTYIQRCGMYSVTNTIGKEQKKQKLLKLRDVADKVKEYYKMDYVFLGMKKADGMNRRLMLNTYAQNHYVNNGMVYPLATWTQKEVLAYMLHHRLPEPIRYGKSASNGVGFNLDCFLWMEKNAPQDLEKMYASFPESRRILYEYHYNNQ
ncbi:MAG: phosphoadenosine phosphosulfate reductase family protein [Paludibacteraceae bacterium]